MQNKYVKWRVNFKLMNYSMKTMKNTSSQVF